MRHDTLFNDALGGGVIEHAFETVADFDAQCTFIFGDNKNGAIIDFFTPQLPLLSHSERELLNGLGRGGGHNQYRDLTAFALLKFTQLLIDLSLLLRRQACGQIDHTT